MRNPLNYSNVHLIYIRFYFSIAFSVACRGYEHETTPPPAPPKLALVSVYASLTAFNNLVMIDVTGRCNNNTYALKIQRGLSYLPSSRSTKNKKFKKRSKNPRFFSDIRKPECFVGTVEPTNYFLFPFREMLMTMFCLKDI